VEAAAAAGIAGLAVEAAGVLLLDRAEAINAADTHGIAIEGLAGGQPPRAHRSTRTGTSDARGLTPSSPKFRFRNAGAPRRESRLQLALSGEQVVPPESSAGVDIAKGLAVIERLAPFQTGKAVVVSRAYILSIAAADSAFDMLERTRALRQWGVGAKRRVGVMVCRAGAAEWNAESVALLLDKAAAAGLVCIAVTGPAAALAPFADAGSLADRHELVLVTREERP
jgi:hypothetical protein